MKEAVLKLIQDEIDSFDHPSAARTAMRMLFNKVSALPEQGYTREQVIDSIEKAFRAGRTLEETDGNSSDLAATTKYILSSLTPVAVEADRTERWIAIADKTPDERHDVMWMKFPVTEPGYYGTFIDENFPGMEYFTHWMSLGHLWPDGDLPKDSLAPQVNNDKTK